ncbi:aminotransferase class I/II-fold pyridoxal phosphate-dependent enzyme [Streptomyces olivaceus]|uniref:Aminotransferase class I/II-fold pyridoxal phosphate-dependent enzyme n=1 Tax=Streptomyces olivaceus TaxID=47716 RepID=A0ABS7WEF0_STROV|nr:aminotransferase class I/II-fold pyridoxal phosphate-dependent enzyme [Streptomyces olivaceus]MBZ6093503.1 aminotransferase class I/II-fold pyridoxal phosphate-dependent enzyme [Streptomyces olivaceus]MBZ6100436.1 aminotransferase class I/II-fold pyridoxal phosphate-dependent enzyme [Streptomyces olivaceus]MBZ6121600.1 aminotransferase class I/II-fold pyridoxal phosphate-dependent enzyme [Streptomyces olivaceus]MBZ6156336.1 aminotransferase class I/II-fold pyridoxal phosphate-dependent enzym
MRDEHGLHEPLERFGRLHAKALRHPGGPLDLSYPNTRTGRDPRAFELLRDLLKGASQEDLQYTPFGGSTPARRRAASALTRRFDVPVGFRHIVLTPGGTAALNVSLAALFAPGDEVVVVTPCWMDYPLYLHRLGLRAVETHAGPEGRLDPDAIAAAFGPRTAGVIISQPVCPTGVVHSAAELAALARVLESTARRVGRRPVLISDEVHRDQVWDGEDLTVPMQLYPDVVSVYSFGKAWSLQGQRTGYLALGPGLRTDSHLRRLDRAMRAGGYCAPTALMQRLVTEIADFEPDCGPLRRDQLAVRSLLDELGYRAVPGQGTAFVYVRCPQGDDWTFVEELAGRGLIVMPSSVFHEPGHFRLALNLGPERHAEVARRLGPALPGLGPASVTPRKGMPS